MAKMTLAQAAKALGISTSATMKELKHAYRTLSQKCHPDKVPESEKAQAHELWLKIQEAYEVFKSYLESSNTNTGASQNTGNTGHQQSNYSGNRGQNHTGANSGYGDPHNDPIVKMYWETYQRACKDHEKFVNGELAQSRAKIGIAEQALKSAMGQPNEKELTAVETLAHLLRNHQLLIAQVKMLVKLKEQSLKDYNNALARYNHNHTNGGR